MYIYMYMCVFVCVYCKSRRRNSLEGGRGPARVKNRGGD